MGRYRIINDYEEDAFALLVLVPKQAGFSRPDFDTLYESKSKDCDHFDIAKLEHIVKTILVFM
jgi:hypothetical protein